MYSALLRPIRSPAIISAAQATVASLYTDTDSPVAAWNSVATSISLQAAIASRSRPGTSDHYRAVDVVAGKQRFQILVARLDQVRDLREGLDPAAPSTHVRFCACGAPHQVRAYEP